MNNKTSLIVTAFALSLSLNACSNNLRDKGKRYDEKRANEKIDNPSTPPSGAGSGGNSPTSTDTSSTSRSNSNLRNTTDSTTPNQK